MVVIVTGRRGGIGMKNAIGISLTGARVIVTGRNQERGEAAVERIKEESKNSLVELAADDVSLSAGVDALAKNVLERDASSGGKIGGL